ncbi:hypothetical protein Z043_108706 [Scleropages formosus]|nr:hypothetical protein Z043_108706 [Scleropages formosus]
MLSEQELTCSICLDIFSDPVSTPCGHNFCQSCIGRYWATSSTWNCPLCKRQFSERPELAVNRVFAHITSKCKETCFTAEGQDPPAGVSSLVITCDICTGRKMKAVSTCLTCTASYCDIHVQPHLQNPNYSHHKLLDPSDAFQGRTCPIHNRLLEVYCCTDQACICAICVMQEHCNHRTVSVQTERARKQKFLGKIQFEIQRKTEEKSAKLTALTNKVESLRNFAQNEISQVENILMDLSRSVERIRGELVGGIMEKQAAMEARGEEYISHLEAEVEQLRERQANLESQATSEDHIGFLQ